jgi:hypothetical protein
VRVRLVSVVVGACVVLAALSTAVARADDTVYVTAPNGGAKLSGALTWHSKRHWTMNGTIRDTACNSHSVYVDIYVNVRYANDHGLGNQWPGLHLIKHVSNSAGCGNTAIVYVDYTDPSYDDHDVDFNVCDNSAFDSCSGEAWNSSNWYGVYHNIFTSY